MTGQERLRKEQQRKIQRAIDDFYSNRPTERDSLGAALQNAFETLSSCSEIPNSSDTISRREVLDALRDAENHSFNSFYQGLVKEHKIIADMPSAQKEIVRCRICKYGGYNPATPNKHRPGDAAFPAHWRCYYYKKFKPLVSPDDFCSRAERRTNE